MPEIKKDKFVYYSPYHIVTVENHFVYIISIAEVHMIIMVPKYIEYMHLNL